MAYGAVYKAQQKRIEETRDPPTLVGCAEEADRITEERLSCRAAAWKQTRKQPTSAEVHGKALAVQSSCASGWRKGSRQAPE